MGLIDDARRMRDTGVVDPRSLSRIVLALELIEKLGFSFDLERIDRQMREQDDGLHVISRPKQRRLISERASRVMAAAELVTIAYEEERILFGRPPGSRLSAAIEALDEALGG